MSDRREYSRFSIAVTSLLPATAGPRSSANGGYQLCNCTTANRPRSNSPLFRTGAGALFDIGRAEIERRQVDLRDVDLHFVGIDRRQPRLVMHDHAREHDDRYDSEELNQYE